MSEKPAFPILHGTSGFSKRPTGWGSWEDREYYMMAAKNHALLLRASTIALALGGMTAVATPAWADDTVECKRGTVLDPVTGLEFELGATLECGVGSLADGFFSIAVGPNANAAVDNTTAVFHIYDGGYCQPSEVRGGSHE